MNINESTYYKNKISQLDKYIKITGLCGILFFPIWIGTIFFIIERKNLEKDLILKESNISDKDNKKFVIFKTLELEAISLERKYNNMEILELLADKELALEKVDTITTEQLILILDKRIDKYKLDGLTKDQILKKLLLF